MFIIHVHHQHAVSRSEGNASAGKHHAALEGKGDYHHLVLNLKFICLQSSSQASQTRDAVHPWCWEMLILARAGGAAATLDGSSPLACRVFRERAWVVS